MDNTQLLVTVKEAAIRLGIGSTKLREMIARGEIPVIRIGRAVRIAVSVLEEWVKHQVLAARENASQYIK
jgi:excisionase family DNA binding protein